MRTRIRKWGNSAVVQIPASVMHAARMNLGEVVDVREEKGRIVIEPMRQKTYVLPKLIARITSKNRHEPFDFGPAVGKEV